jgi:DNA-binding IclR family transcriptional regulator
MNTRQIFTLHLEKDADLIAWLKAQPNKSAAIRDALRAQFERQTEYTLADVMQRLDEIERNGVVMTHRARDAGDEPVEAAAALDTLGI